MKLTEGEEEEASPPRPKEEKFWEALKTFLLAFPKAWTCCRSSGGDKRRDAHIGANNYFVAAR